MITISVEFHCNTCSRQWMSHSEPAKPRELDPSPEELTADSEVSLTKVATECPFCGSTAIYAMG